MFLHLEYSSEIPLGPVIGYLIVFAWKQVIVYREDLINKRLDMQKAR